MLHIQLAVFTTVMSCSHCASSNAYIVSIYSLCAVLTGHDIRGNKISVAMAERSAPRAYDNGYLPINCIYEVQMNCVIFVCFFLSTGPVAVGELEHFCIFFGDIFYFASFYCIVLSSYFLAVCLATILFIFGSDVIVIAYFLWDKSVSNCCRQFYYVLNCVLTNLFFITVVVEVVMGAVGAGTIIEMVDLTDISMVETVHVHIERIFRSSTFYVMRIVV